jgi:hypothetical protein
LRLIPRHRPARKSRATAPHDLTNPSPTDLHPPVDDADNPNETRTPVRFANGTQAEMVIVGHPFGGPGRAEQPVDPETALAEGTRALAEAWYGEKS